jgi:hypothetical protein
MRVGREIFYTHTLEFAIGPSSGSKITNCTDAAAATGEWSSAQERETKKEQKDIPMHPQIDTTTTCCLNPYTLHWKEVYPEPVW